MFGCAGLEEDTSACNVLETYDTCSRDQPCNTSTRGQCAVPFKFDGQTFLECTSYKSSEQGFEGRWCSLTGIFRLALEP